MIKFFNKNKKKGFIPGVPISLGFNSCKEMAEAIQAKIDSKDMLRSIEKVELSKIGKAPDKRAGFFLNVFLKDSFVEAKINRIKSLKTNEIADLAAKGVEEKQTILVDFSSPNIAKNMHVGHLRSTI